MKKFIKPALRTFVYVGAVGLGMFIAATITYGIQPPIILGAIEALSLSVLAEIAYLREVAQEKEGRYVQNT